MKTFHLLLPVIVLSVFNSFSQIDELRKAQDARIAKLKKNGGSYFSKSLFVDPFIGTGGHGHTYPGASAPFGMMQLSPDTRHDGWDGCSGYHYSDSIIYGFSHTHLSGTGVPDYADLLIVPQSGSAKTVPGYISSDGYGSIFSHEKESASPGYYSVHLDDEDIDVQLTVSERSGIHQYSFNNPNDRKYILIDLDHRDKLLDANFKLIDNSTIEGKRVSSAWANEQHFYFYLKSSEPWKKAQIIKKDNQNKLLLIFDKKAKTILLKVGISAVDEHGAKRNLELEIPDWDFNAARAKVTSKWNRELDRINFFVEDREIMTNFYTGLYHSFLNPNIFNDVDGRYRGRDNQIHELTESEGNNYTVFSLWDTYRATHPLFTITQIKRTNEFIRTFIRQFEQGGDLPVWELAGNETECMIGYHSVSVISDAYTKGIQNYDAVAALQAMIQTSRFNEFGKQNFRFNGYIGVGDEPESVSKTLEYAYDDFCIDQMIKSLNGITDFDTNYFHKSSFNFVNVFDPETKFMRARRDGLWFSPFDPSEVNFNYTEANSWQYSLYAPHAIGVLTKLLGGKDSLEGWLDRLFTTNSNLSGRHQVDITGLIGQYAHGNEPSHHIAYLYNYTNNPSKTQSIVDRIQKEMYRHAPDGLSGNEDCGQMSSWYVLSALGIYQIAPGNPYYEIGRPLMEKAEIELPNKSKFIISTINNSTENSYIKSATLNGKPLDRLYLQHNEIMAGGELVLEMTSDPIAFSLISAPTYTDLPSNFSAVPYFVNASRVFEESQVIQLRSVNDNSIIYYTLDGTEATDKSTKYTNPFVINENTTIRAVAYSNNVKSGEIKNIFVKKRNDIHIKINGEYSNQYAAVGDFTLIDGIRGGNEYRTGDWQGYWDQKVSFEVSFDNPTLLDSIGIGFLRDMKSWIFYPETVKFEVQYVDEPGEWKQTGIILGKVTETEQFPQHKTISIDIDENRAVRKIKISTETYDQCPEWHLGVGNPTWLFVDEIFIKEK